MLASETIFSRCLHLGELQNLRKLKFICCRYNYYPPNEQTNKRSKQDLPNNNIMSEQLIKDYAESCKSWDNGGPGGRAHSSVIEPYEHQQRMLAQAWPIKFLKYSEKKAKMAEDYLKGEADFRGKGGIVHAVFSRLEGFNGQVLVHLTGLLIRVEALEKRNAELEEKCSGAQDMSAILNRLEALEKKNAELEDEVENRLTRLAFAADQFIEDVAREPERIVGQNTRLEALEKKNAELQDVNTLLWEELASGSDSMYKIQQSFNTLKDDVNDGFDYLEKEVEKLGNKEVITVNKCLEQDLLILDDWQHGVEWVDGLTEFYN